MDESRRGKKARKKRRDKIMSTDRIMKKEITDVDKRIENDDYR